MIDFPRLKQLRVTRWHQKRPNHLDGYLNLESLSHELTYRKWFNNKNIKCNKNKNEFVYHGGHFKNTSSLSACRRPFTWYPVCLFLTFQSTKSRSFPKKSEFETGTQRNQPNKHLSNQSFTNHFASAVGKNYLIACCMFATMPCIDIATNNNKYIIQSWSMPTSKELKTTSWRLIFWIILLQALPWQELTVDLAGGFNTTHLKNMRKSNWIISPGMGKNIKHIWNHHLVNL